MHNVNRILSISIALQLSLSTLLLASMVTRIAASAPVSSLAAAIFLDTNSSHLRPNTPKDRRRRENIKHADLFARRLEQSLVESTYDSGDDGDDDDDDDQPKTSSNGTTVCTPIAECELCPHKWKVLIEKEEEKIKGEYDSCLKYGRRRQFECTVLFPENESSRKIARSSSEYRECRFTETDEQFRLLRMQMICLFVGVWAMRNVRKQKVASASLFDQRRMRLQSANGSSAISSAKKYSHSVIQRKDSMETVELIPISGAGKIPKSPAPNPTSDSYLETV